MAEEGSAGMNPGWVMKTGLAWKACTSSTKAARFAPRVSGVASVILIRSRFLSRRRSHVAPGAVEPLGARVQRELGVLPGLRQVDRLAQALVDALGLEERLQLGQLGL